MSTAHPMMAVQGVSPVALMYTSTCTSPSTATPVFTLGSIQKVTLPVGLAPEPPLGGGSPVATGTIRGTVRQQRMEAMEYINISGKAFLRNAVESFIDFLFSFPLLLSNTEIIIRFKL